MTTTETLSQAHQQLFQRTPDQIFETFPDLVTFCDGCRDASNEQWYLPQQIAASPVDSRLGLSINGESPLRLNDWSFGQLSTLARVSKGTVNRLSSATAALVFQETLPCGQRPLQILAEGQRIRSIHGATYTRLWNSEVLSVIDEFTNDFDRPQTASGGGTGLYAGEQDLFAFMIDPTGWIEIEGEAFAPGFFVWNSEVGRRSVGISTFWFQSICANHIVWDAMDVTELARKHTRNVHDALNDIRQAIERLVAKRVERRDGFASTMTKAMQLSLGSNSDEVLKALVANGIGKKLAQRSLEIAAAKGRFSIFAVVDALTQLAQQLPFAGIRLDADAKAAALLSLAV